MRLTNDQKSIIFICRQITRSITGNDIDNDNGYYSFQDIWDACPNTFTKEKCQSVIDSLVRRKIFDKDNDNDYFSFNLNSEYYNEICDKLAERFYKEAGWTPVKLPN